MIGRIRHTSLWNLGILPVLAMLLVAPLAMATPGTFRGTLVDPPAGEAGSNILYLRAKNGNVRRVNIAKAAFAFDESVPQKGRTGEPKTLLKAGIEVRVTAEQGSDGEWLASRVDILGDEASMQSAEDEDDSNDSFYPDLRPEQGTWRRI